MRQIQSLEARLKATNGTAAGAGGGVAGDKEAKRLLADFEVGLRDVKGATNMHRANDYYYYYYSSNESRRRGRRGASARERVSVNTKPKGGQGTGRRAS